MPARDNNTPTVLRSGLLVWLRTLLVMIAVLTLARGILLASRISKEDTRHGRCTARQ